MPEIAKTYDPQSREEGWYAQWMEKGFFTANPASGKPAYSIVIPPPNVTGVLTMGHVLNNTIQDILARRKRMQGYEVLWLPGTDHAGIATQTAVEKALKKQGVIRHRNDLGREKFLEKIWEWKEKHGGIIIQQLKKLGCSCDWSRERFTMDEHYSRCVLQVFVDLYKKGYIYRGKRMVNWDVVSQSALSDEEVIMKEVQGNLWHLRYPILEEEGGKNGRMEERRDEHTSNLPPFQPSAAFVVVATTRPETMLGDEAVAVNPDDTRYQHLIGKKVLLPLQNKPIPIIADSFVDMKFGTGCVKVTPAHDPNDYEMGVRHKLPFPVVIGADGKMTDAAGEKYKRLDRFECRKQVVADLEAQGLIEKIEPHKHNVGYSERTDVPIEPFLSEQWFFRYCQVERSTAAVEKNEINFYPERWEKVYAHWMSNIKDWCISRQLWWGHRIPVWYRVGQASSLSLNQNNQKDKLEACPTFVGFDEFAEVDVSRRKLPHWRQSGTTYFVTFRLADSLPQSQLEALEAERLRWLAHHSEALSEADKREYFRLFSERVEEWLDNGHGSCALKDERAAQIVADALRHFDGERYALDAWVVMPNHVHAIVTPKEGHELSDILHSWKSFTANRINELLGRTGQFWQHENYDHIVRSDSSLFHIRQYIERNPEKAGIKVGQASSLSLNIKNLKDKLEACPTLYVGTDPPPDPENWTQDPDVLDTWFSSWLWAFATMGWEQGKEPTPTLKKFYPTTDLVTGPDIIFFWVARMIMAGYEYMGEKPFSNVYFTGIIRDAQGRKMSKSLGNSPDPLDLIAKYGADGLRFGLMLIAPQGQDIRFDEKQCEQGRNFMNKLWNAARFIEMQRATNPPARAANPHDLNILAELQSTVAKVSAALDTYEFNVAAKELYDFVWGDFCDWYIEASKVSPNIEILDKVFSTTLKLLHPFAPFITEELWHSMGYGKDTIQFEPWTKPESVDSKALDLAPQTRALYGIVTAARQLRSDNGIEPRRKVSFVIKPHLHGEFFQSEIPFLQSILNAESVKIDANYTPTGLTLSTVGESATLFMVGAVDADAERKRLTKQLDEITAQLAQAEAKLGNENFVARAKPEAVEKERERQRNLSEQKQKVESLLAALK
jgi:valyl-tRNA synthetase